MNQIEETVAALESFIERKEQWKRSAPLRYLFWEATLRCNLQCLHCGSDCVRNDSTQAQEISAEAIKRELRSIAEAYPPEQITFAIIGGEPLIRPEIYDVGACAHGLGYNWGITSNGTMLDAGTVRKLKEAGLSTITVSLDGLAAEHDELRKCQGSHARAVNGIRQLMKERFWRKFDVICCVSKLNIDKLAPFLDEVVALGVPAIRFSPIFSRGRAGINGHLMLERVEYLSLLHFIKEQRKTMKEIRINLSEEGYWGPEWECEVRDAFHYCASGIKIGSILHDGKVTGCPSISRNFIEGNIRETPFVELWQKGFQRYREGRKQTFAHHCGDCDQWELCEGGGFHLLEQADGSEEFCCLRKIRERSAV